MKRDGMTRAWPLCPVLQYVRVMPAGGQCYEEGPFFPSVPRFAVQVGIGRRRELLLSPDRAAIAGVTTGLLLVLATSLALAVSTRHTGVLREYHEILGGELTIYVFP